MIKSRLPSPTGRGFGSHRVGWSNRLGGTGVDGACRRRMGWWDCRMGETVKGRCLFLKKDIRGVWGLNENKGEKSG